MEVDVRPSWMFTSARYNTAVDGFIVNPESGLWQQNAVLNGRSHHYATPEVEGTLSIKSVLHGTGAWITPKRRYVVQEGAYLVLNHGQRYSVDICSRETVETLCVFFRPGFIDAVKSAARAVGLQPSSQKSQPEFYERLNPLDGEVGCALARIHLLSKGRSSEMEREDAMIRMAESLLAAHADANGQVASLPSIRPSVREEIFARLNEARDYMLSNLPLAHSLEEISKHASLSPFHFHRLFRASFRQTPHEFLSKLRIERAKTLLARTNQPITSIGEQVGFETLAAFGKRFHASTGVTPSAFRSNFARSD